MFVAASENYRILTEAKRESSVLYGPVASIAPAVLPEIMKKVDALNSNETDVTPEESPAETRLPTE